MTINITPLTVGAMACLVGLALLARPQPATAGCIFIFCTLDSEGTAETVATNEFRNCQPQYAPIAIVYPKDGETIWTTGASAEVPYQVHVSRHPDLVCSQAHLPWYAGFDPSGWKVDIVFRRSDGKTVAPSRGILSVGGRAAGSVVLERGSWEMHAQLFEPQRGSKGAHATVMIGGVQQWPAPAASKEPVKKKMLEFQPSPQSKTVKETKLKGGAAPQGKGASSKVSALPNKAIKKKITTTQTGPMRPKRGTPQAKPH